MPGSISFLSEWQASFEELYLMSDGLSTVADFFDGLYRSTIGPLWCLLSELLTAPLFTILNTLAYTQPPRFLSSLVTMVYS